MGGGGGVEDGGSGRSQVKGVKQRETEGGGRRGSLALRGVCEHSGPDCPVESDRTSNPCQAA